MVHEGNKDEAEKCFKLAQDYFQELNRDKALRFAHKANRLFPNERYTDFIDLINRLNATVHGQPNGTSGLNSNTSTSTPNNENVRQRRSETTTQENSSSGLSHDYTDEQVVAVKRIKKCKDYYEILGLAKDSTETDFKKSYRKLALQFHPDKNKAPGADEAFKAVGNAFAVLNDPEKRKQYDLYGPDEANSHVSQRSSYHQNDYTRGYEGDVTAEELFNMFFGGGYPGGSVYVRRNGRWERSRTGQNHAQRTGHHHEQHSTRTDQSSLSVFLQLMPLLLILMLSLASSFLSSDPIYSLSPTSKYTVTRTTTNLGISFYVKPDFGTEYQGSIRKLEVAIEEDYITSLRSGCYKERNYKENMMWRAKSFGDAHLYRKAQDLRTPSCDALQGLYS